MALGLRIKAAREHLGWEQTELVKRSGVPQPTLSILEVRDSDRSKYTEQLVQAFPPDKINLDWLRTGKGSMVASEPQPEFHGIVTSMRPAPVVGTARLGENGYYDELSTIPGAGDGEVHVLTADKAAYALRVRGDSMTPAIRDGWYVVVAPNAEPAVGEYCLVKLRNGQKMVKELLYRRPDSIAVVSVNGDVRRTIPMDDIEDLQAIAAVVPPSQWRPS